MSWKKMILGEKMPDKNDPQYKERYEKEVGAGRKFARWLKLDKAAEYAQLFALHRPKLFLALVFGIVIGCMGLNIYRLVEISNRPKTETVKTATQRQEELLFEKSRVQSPKSRVDCDDNSELCTLYFELKN